MKNKPNDYCQTIKFIKRQDIDKKSLNLIEN